MRRSTLRALVLACGMLAVINAKAKSDEAVDSTRDSVIQSVRDDVRRKIQERTELPAEKRPEIASEAKSSSASTGGPVHNNPRQDAPK